MEMVDPSVKLAQYLREAAQAHHEFEAKTGVPDPDWAEWYARWLVDNVPDVRWI